MYGTVARMKAKPGTSDLLREFADQSENDRPPGMVSLTVYRSDQDPDEYFVAVVFEDKDAYVANANAPEQDRRFRQLRALLEADPEWHDGEIVYSG